MNYLKYTQYVYLIACLFFIYEGITKFQERSEDYWLWLTIAALCFFMFLFRRRFGKKFEKHGDKKKE
ncbi:hypothetical protein [Flavobacterium silvaticum]|uniref:Uncharacterized protein n=1 Tax=Flavobacterium silvaticum TaxID=1852020 RepID=A0A972FTB6_9FLAO|nr:hypothetical protein [Flavobacterium silvaticum]NMH27170.1 hypothetical protein [Flavobacterium silvaticum]